MRVRGKNRQEQGNMILISIIFTVAMGITIASYLLLVRSQYISTTRSHNWNIAMMLAEAGVDDALALVNKNEGDVTQLQNWPATATADGWTVTNNVFHVRRTPDSSMGYYDVWVTDLGNTVSIRAEGTATWDTTDPNPTETVRKLVVQAGLAPVFPVALGSGGDIDLINHPLVVDSFDPTDPTTRKDNGAVTASGIVKGVSVGTKIYGSVNTGPGGSVFLKQSGSVGDLAWASPGIQPGHGRDDMNVTYPTVKLPNAIYTPITATAPTNYITTPGYYQLIDSYGLQNTLIVTNAPNTVLYLVHGLDYSSWGVAPPLRLRVLADSSLTIYVAEQFVLDGTAAIRNNNTTNNLVIYGLTNLTSINIKNGNAFPGCLYAPQANLNIGVGGGSSIDFTGSVIVGSVTSQKNINVHYNESLRQIDSGHAPARAFVATNWTEL